MDAKFIKIATALTGKEYESIGKRLINTAWAISRTSNSYDWVQTMLSKGIQDDFITPEDIEAKTNNSTSNNTNNKTNSNNINNVIDNIDSIDSINNNKNKILSNYGLNLDVETNSIHDEHYGILKQDNIKLTPTPLFTITSSLFLANRIIYY